MELEDYVILFEGVRSCLLPLVCTRLLVRMDDAELLCASKLTVKVKQGDWRSSSKRPTAHVGLCSSTPRGATCPSPST